MNTENAFQMETVSPQLGRLQKSYRPRVLPGRVMLGASIFCFLMSGVEFISAFNAFARPPGLLDTLSPRYRQDRILIATILGVTLIVIAFFLLALFYAHRKHRVDLYTNGLVVFTWRGSTAFLWDEIRKVKTVPIYGPGRYGRKPVNLTYTLSRSDDLQAQFGGLEGLEGLGRILKEKVPQAIRQGQTS